MKSKLVFAVLAVLLIGGVFVAFQVGAAIPTSVAAESQSAETPPGEYETRSDEQGAVTVAVTPQNLDSSGEALVFEVSLNTHSVDLSMDLAGLATLTTDSGVTVEPNAWEAPSGGHHVAGKLTFPGQVNGQNVLLGATQITLVIRNLDAEERVFSWSLLSDPA